MIARVISGATVGLEAVPIEVEVHVESQGFPAFNIVGLPDKAVDEAKERVRGAIKNSSLNFPARRITVNLAPADLPKKGPAYDLPIALGIILAWEETRKNFGPDVDISDSLLLGELSLNGDLRPVPGALPLTLLAKEKGIKKVFLPSANAKEAAIVAGVAVYPICSLSQLLDHFSNLQRIEPLPTTDFASLLLDAAESEHDLADIKGQNQAKRALEIAAAGGHNVILKGPPGAGKTFLARAFASILPRLTADEALEVTKIYSVSGLLAGGEPLVKIRPFRSPHHTTSRVGLIGGGSHPQPGEISLAHRGVLFLDEFPEFPRHVLEALRGPLEDGVVNISRAAGSLSFPAKFVLVASQNPCPCGYKDDPQNRCICSAHQILKYQKRLSGPLLDRIDLHVVVPAVKQDELMQSGENVPPSAEVRARVQSAREVQQKRFAGTGLACNADLGAKRISEFCELGEAEKQFMRQALLQMKLSARSFHRTLKVSRTIADLSGDNKIGISHLAEALQFRPQREAF